MTSNRIVSSHIIVSHLITRHLRAIALSVICVIASVAAAPSAISSAMAAPFDGDWSVVVQTRDHCGTSRWPLAIVGGQIYLPVPVFVGGYPAGLGGRVSPTGRVTINVVAGPRVASGTGQLGKFRGGGRWAGRGPSGTCAGLWTATRQNTATSAAFMRQ